ncbi:hypothetical protein RJ55_02639 [Drechmeria coniospora]|nr:hypothetical protein RJ55_02639 [Drechmeria coniospora]
MFAAAASLPPRRNVARGSAPVPECRSPLARSMSRSVWTDGRTLASCSIVVSTVAVAVAVAVTVAVTVTFALALALALSSI